MSLPSVVYWRRPWPTKRLQILGSSDGRGSLSHSFYHSPCILNTVPSFPEAFSPRLHPIVKPSGYTNSGFQGRSAISVHSIRVDMFTKRLSPARPLHDGRSCRHDLCVSLCGSGTACGEIMCSRQGRTSWVLAASVAENCPEL